MSTVSVIVPIYNAARYLESCVGSVVEEGVAGTEIVLVDDGSVDGSAEFASGLVAAYRDVNIVLVVCGENGGVSRARNRGLELATGDYCSFLDADDRMAPRGLARMLALADETGADVVAGNIETFREGAHGSQRGRYWGAETQAVFQYQLTGTLDAMPRLVYSVSACAKLYRRRFLLENDLHFEAGVDFAEDQPVAIRSYALADRITICADVVYHYRIDNEHSAMHAAFRLARFERIRDVVRGNLAELDGWPRYYYIRRALDYEILQNVRRIGALPWDEARRAFAALRDAMMACDADVCSEYVRESNRHRTDYDDLVRGACRRAWIRHAPLASRLRRILSLEEATSTSLRSRG